MKTFMTLIAGLIFAQTALASVSDTASIAYTNEVLNKYKKDILPAGEWQGTMFTSYSCTVKVEWLGDSKTPVLKITDSLTYLPDLEKKPNSKPHERVTLFQASDDLAIEKESSDDGDEYFSIGYYKNIAFDEENEEYVTESHGISFYRNEETGLISHFTIEDMVHDHISDPHDNTSYCYDLKKVK